MAYLVKIKVKKRKGELNFNSTGELNAVLLNLDNIVDIERINDRIHFTLTNNKERIGVWEDAEAAKAFFDKLYSDF